MEITHIRERQKLIEWATKIKRLSDERGDTSSSVMIQHEIEELRSGRFMLAVLGKVKRGKSTFCNAFLGRQNDLVAPVDKLPASSVISKFKRSANEEAKVHFQNGKTETTDFRHIVDYVTEQRNPENTKKVAFMEVWGTFPGLEEDLVLVDTPGAGSMHKHHDALLYGFLPEADAVIFLVTARMPIAEDELELLKALKEQDIQKIFFAMNQCDLVEDETMTDKELEDAIEHNHQMLAKASVNVDKIYRISAKRAMLGNVSSSGIPELLGDVSDFLNKNKLAILHSRFSAKIISAAESMGRNLAVEIESSNKSQVELELDLKRLQEARVRTDAESQRVGKEFKFEWDSAVEELAQELVNAEEAVKNRVQKKIHDEFPLLGANQYIKAVPTLIAKAMEEEVSIPASRFETTTKAAVEKLQLQYPNVTVTQKGEVVIRVEGQTSTLMKGASGGALAAAAGYGLLSAASTAAVVVSSTALAPWAAGLATLFNPATGLVSSILTSLGIGTVTTTATTIPAWAVFAGPVGWALIGVGALVLPFAYRASNLKSKEAVENAALDHIRKSFAFLLRERVPQLKRTGARILEEYQIKFQNDLAHLESAIQNGLQRKAAGKPTKDIESLADELKLLMEDSAQVLTF